MKAIILAAGKGTRVRPLTYSVPKPMIPILNQPVMESLVHLLAQHQFDQIMVNTSYLSTNIESYFRDGARLGVDMAYSFEGYIEDGKVIDEPVGSAGALRKIHDHSGFFDETFLVLCGDALIDLDLTQLVAMHKKNGGIATIALANVPKNQVSSYGVVVTDETGKILEFQEKPAVEAAKSTTVNTGIYVFEPEILDFIPSGQVYDIGSQLFPALVKANAGLYGVSIPFQWLDIGKVPDYYHVMQQVLQNQVSNIKIPGREIAPGIHVGLNVRVDLALSQLTPPIYIGGSAHIEPGATIIGPTMIGSGSVVEKGAHVEKSIIFEYTRVGSLAHVKNMMICGGYSVDSQGTVIDLNRTDIGWVVGDARSRKQALTEDQQLLLDMLQDLNKETP